MTGDELLEPFDWYNSGRYWYCSLQRPDGTKVSGCGRTKPQAVDDARHDLKRIDAKRERNRKYDKRRSLGAVIISTVDATISKDS